MEKEQEVRQVPTDKMLEFKEFLSYCVKQLNQQLSLRFPPVNQDDVSQLLSKSNYWSYYYEEKDFKEVLRMFESGEFRNYIPDYAIRYDTYPQYEEYRKQYQNEWARNSDCHTKWQQNNRERCREYNRNSYQRRKEKQLQESAIS